MLLILCLCLCVCAFESTPLSPCLWVCALVFVPLIESMSLKSPCLWIHALESVPLILCLCACAFEFAFEPVPLSPCLWVRVLESVYCRSWWFCTHSLYTHTHNWNRYFHPRLGCGVTCQQLGNAVLEALYKCSEWINETRSEVETDGTAVDCFEM